MNEKSLILVGAPMDCGKRRQGCRMGTEAYRVAGIAEALSALGHTVRDLGDVTPGPNADVSSANPDVHELGQVVAWTTALATAAQEAAGQGVPVFMGGDHALSLGTVSGIAAHARDVDRPLFVLWLDAHSDYHSPLTTASGNLHGTPVGFFTGRDGFDGWPEMTKVPASNVCMIGLRSVDAAERAELIRHDFTLADMRRIDEVGMAAVLRPFLDRVAAADGLLHVSLDVDFLEPSIAPAVGTTVPGGATFREAHLAMEMLSDSGLVSSLDLVELNPMLDDRGQTAGLMVDLTASLFGKQVFDRPTAGLSGLPSGVSVH